MGGSGGLTNIVVGYCTDFYVDPIYSRCAIIVIVSLISELTSKDQVIIEQVWDLRLDLHTD